MVKSSRNGKKCQPKRVIDQYRELIAHQCPPDMTEAIKDAFLKEIAEFDELDVVVAKKEAEDSSHHKTPAQDYTDWIRDRSTDGRNTGPVEANPDLLSEHGGLNYLPMVKDPVVAKMLKEFREGLSKRERQVWNLIMGRQMTRRQVASLLSISERSVSIYLRRGHVKFMQFAERIKHAQ